MGTACSRLADLATRFGGMFLAEHPRSSAQRILLSSPLLAPQSPKFRRGNIARRAISSLRVIAKPPARVQFLDPSHLGFFPGRQSLALFQGNIDRQKSDLQQRTNPAVNMPPASLAGSTEMLVVPCFASEVRTNVANL